MPSNGFSEASGQTEHKTTITMLKFNRKSVRNRFRFGMAFRMLGGRCQNHNRSNRAMDSDRIRRGGILPRLFGYTKSRMEGRKNLSSRPRVFYSIRASWFIHENNPTTQKWNHSLRVSWSVQVSRISTRCKHRGQTSGYLFVVPR